MKPIPLTRDLIKQSAPNRATYLWALLTYRIGMKRKIKKYNRGNGGGPVAPGNSLLFQVGTWG